jgi:hypothetical protein
MARKIMANPLSGLQKVGKAKLQIIFFDVYYSTLYSAGGKYLADEYPIALDIEYLRDIKAKDLVDTTKREWQKLGFEKTQISHWIALIKNAWPDVKKGDSLLFRVDLDGSSEFFFNGVSLNKIVDTAFGKSFLAIWLTENCSYPKVRRKLIGR